MRQTARLVLADLRDHAAGTARYRHGGTRFDVWATELSAAPPPNTPPAITAAIRHYVTALDGLLAEHSVRSVGDHGPLMALLDAFDNYS